MYALHTEIQPGTQPDLMMLYICYHPKTSHAMTQVLPAESLPICATHPHIALLASHSERPITMPHSQAPSAATTLRLAQNTAQKLLSSRATACCCLCSLETAQHHTTTLHDDMNYCHCQCTRTLRHFTRAPLAHNMCRKL